MEIKVVKGPINIQAVKRLAEQQFGNLIKAAVDVKRGVMALGGELHADEEQLLLKQGSKQTDLWGINLYPAKFGSPGFIEFDSMINIRPSQGNRSRGVEDPKLRQKIREIVHKLVAKN
ncbi:hypothetical protein HY441_02180 [Candidatus Microgenomates bacterium]|nr:hypothetical protein [Candidatus Microgenomates bacterium]